MRSEYIPMNNISTNKCTNMLPCCNLQTSVWKVFFLSILYFALYACPAFANERLIVPVFYATDRLLNNLSTNNIYYLDEQTIPVRVSYGVKNIVLTDQPRTNELERIQGLGWQNIIPGTGVAINSSEVKTSTLTLDELTSKLKAIVDEGPSSRPLIVYVNGCCIEYEKSMQDGAKLECMLGAPVIVFAWAAKPPTMDYYRDNEIRQHNANLAFTEFLQALESKIGSERIILVAHSLGNRFVYKTLRYRNWIHRNELTFPKFRMTAFVCADVDVDCFANDESGIAANSQHTIVTKNNTDPALFASSAQRGFYGRLGAPGDAIVNLTRTDTVDFYDIERLYFKKHDFPLPVITDLIRQVENGYAAKYLYLQEKPHLIKVSN